MRYYVRLFLLIASSLWVQRGLTAAMADGSRLHLAEVFAGTAISFYGLYLLLMERRRLLYLAHNDLMLRVLTVLNGANCAGRYGPFTLLLGPGWAEHLESPYKLGDGSDASITVRARILTIEPIADVWISSDLSQWDVAEWRPE